MKAKEKRMILILVFITILVIIIGNSIKKNKKELENEEHKNTLIESLVQEDENGMKKSISSKIKEEKLLENLKVTDIEVIEKNGEATILANITNNTENRKEEFSFTIRLLNRSGEVIQEVGAYVGTILKGETRAIHASVNMDISEIYDMQFVK